jgi:hypothetical protein
MNQDDLDSELERALGDLPALDLPPARVEALRARAHATLAASAAPQRRRTPTRARWRLELGLTLAVAAAQLIWAFEAAMVAYR